MGVGSENILLNQFGGLAKNLGRYSDDIAKKGNRPVEEFFVDGITGKDGRTWRSYLHISGRPRFGSRHDGRFARRLVSRRLTTRVCIRTRLSITANRLDMANLTAQVGTVETLMRRAFNDIAYGDRQKPVGFAGGRCFKQKLRLFYWTRHLPRRGGRRPAFCPTRRCPIRKSRPKGYEQSQSVGVVVSDRGGNPQEQKSYAGVRGLNDRARQLFQSNGDR